MRFPGLAELRELGSHLGDILPEQGQLDRIIERKLLKMTSSESEKSPVASRRKIDEAIDVLKSLGFPGAQQNERSGLTLLALLDVKPNDEWGNASNPLMGVTPMMDFFSQHYGKRYAPNTRETVRRQTVHQFRDAGLILQNPDDLDRPVNSPNAVYQIDPTALYLLRTYGTDEWQANLRTYLASVKTLGRALRS